MGVQLDDGSKVAGWLDAVAQARAVLRTMADWGWPEHATPGYIAVPRAADKIDRDAARWCWCPPSGCRR